MIAEGDLRCQKAGLENADEDATDHKLSKVFGCSCTSRRNTKGQHHTGQTDFPRANFGENSHDGSEDDEHDIVKG